MKDEMKKSLIISKLLCILILLLPCITNAQDIGLLFAEMIWA